MARIVNTYDVPRLNSQHDGRYRYETVQPHVLGLKQMRGEIVVYPPGSGGASHWHEGTEHLFYVTEGRGTLYVNGEPREVKAGDFIAVFDGERHRFENHTDETFAFLELFSPIEYKTTWERPDRK
jgi:quercetin dioxygenase-like cupin family protein